MSSKYFRTDEHIFPCQHIREWPRATASGLDETLHLAVRQYTPLDNPSPQPGDVTIIGCHANGFPKELYEPLWDELYLTCKAHSSFRIRSIWIADIAMQGKSSVLNEHLLGSDVSWMDHPRDLLHMVNLKRDEMVRPIIGIGHSMGANNLVALSLMHPRLFASLILIDPTLQPSTATLYKELGLVDKDARPTEFSYGITVARLSAVRRDLWPSRKAAAESFRKAKFYQAWDERVLDLWIEHGLRDCPTFLYPQEEKESGNPKVTLTTSKHLEVHTFGRPNLSKSGVDGRPIDRVETPDVNPEQPPIYPLYGNAMSNVFFKLPEVRPSVQYIFGGTSEMSSPILRKAKVEATGIGNGGSGGAKEGRVKEVVFKTVSHLVAMEVPKRTAEACADWMKDELKLWKSREDDLIESYNKQTLREKRTMSKELLDTVDAMTHVKGKSKL